MSDFQAGALVLAFVITGHPVYVYHMKHLIRLSHIISTGTVNGAAMSITDRWSTFANAWTGMCISLCIHTLMFGILAATAAGTIIPQEGLRYFAYLYALNVIVAALITAGYLVVVSRHLTSILHQAEAD